MKTTYTREEKKKEPKKRRFLRDFLEAEYLLDFLKKYWSTTVLFVVLSIFTIIHEQNITKLKNLNRKYDNEYQETLSKLKKSNQFIPYEQSQELLQMLQERGFVKNEENRYKITVTEE